MARYYRLQQKVTISVGWTYELVDKGKDDFYVRLRPVIHRGGKAGANRVVRIGEGNYDKFITERQYNTMGLEQQLIDAIQKDKDLKREIAEKANKALKGSPMSRTSAFTSPLGVKNALSLQTKLSKEDKAYAKEQEQQEEREYEFKQVGLGGSYWTQSAIDKVMKEQKEKEEGEK